MFCNKMLVLRGHYRTATILALVTVFYNILEGLVSIWFGSADETVSLFGFGLDSFVEVISGIGIWHMIRRLGRGEPAEQDVFEQHALKITGGAFYLLTFGLSVTAAITLLQGHRPVTTVWGTIISVVSIITMQVLVHFKVKVGTVLNSPAILADAACTRTCMQLSFVLLLASIGYSLTGVASLDTIGSLLIAAISFREGRESFHKAQGLACLCSCSRK